MHDLCNYCDNFLLILLKKLFTQHVQKSKQNVCYFDCPCKKVLKLVSFYFIRIILVCRNQNIVETLRCLFGSWALESFTRKLRNIEKLVECNYMSFVRRLQS